jgi:hypothetical protein
MKRLLSILFLTFLYLTAALSQDKLIRVGEVPGYVTLKCDFHMHTVFSDGEVWPTVRIEEAAKEGLDAIAITDHIEYQPNKEYISADLNAAWKIAGETARKKNIILVHGAEITRKMPPGHFNALFIEDAGKLTDKDFITVIREAIRQGAFIEWNHPGWKAQRPKGDAHLDSIHKVLLANGWLHGIELFNDIESYQGVLTLCIEHHLAVMANSDIHIPYETGYYPGSTHHRPMTLVFAKDRNEKELKEALFAGRTIVWYGDSLAGDKALADPFVKSCLTMGPVYCESEKYCWREIINNSDILFEIVVKSDDKLSDEPLKVSLSPNSITRLRLPVSLASRFVCTFTNVKVSDNVALEIISFFADSDLTIP